MLSVFFWSSLNVDIRILVVQRTSTMTSVNLEQDKQHTSSGQQPWYSFKPDHTVVRAHSISPEQRSP